MEYYQDLKELKGHKTAYIDYMADIVICSEGRGYCSDYHYSCDRYGEYNLEQMEKAINIKYADYLVNDDDVIDWCLFIKEQITLTDKGEGEGLCCL